MRRHTSALAIGVMASSAALVASGLPTVGPAAGATPTPGITSNSVTVGAIVTQSGFLAADFAPELDGIRAYLSMVNSQGGVNGRKINLKYALDDNSNPTANNQLAHTLVQQDKVFAVVGIGSAFFSAASYLASSKTPTYGYATSDNWSPANNLFAAYGSYVSFSGAASPIAYAATQVHAKSIGVVSYGIEQSSKECNALVTAFTKLKLKVGYKDTAIGYGGDPTPDVLRMRSAGVDFVVSCMDVGGNVALARAMTTNGLANAKSMWFDGYDRTWLTKFTSLYRNAYVVVQHLPFEAASAYPTNYPGMNTYLAQMNHTAPSSTYSEVAMDGWLSAALFVNGLRNAGKNPTQASLIAATNALRAFTGGGLTTPVDWSVAHKAATPPSCESFVQAIGNKFEMAFNRGANPWVCFPISGTINLAHPVAPPAGSPGA